MLRSMTTHTILRTFRFFSSLTTKAQTLAYNAGKSISRLEELKEITKQLGSHDEAIKIMQKKYPGLFISATKEEIRKNLDALTEAAKNPGGYS